MRYSVRVTFHVNADSKELANEAVESALDAMFGMHWRDMQTEGAYIDNATVLHKYTVAHDAGSEAGT
jgi:hypothetical protein